MHLSGRTGSSVRAAKTLSPSNTTPVSLFLRSLVITRILLLFPNLLSQMLHLAGSWVAFGLLHLGSVSQFMFAHVVTCVCICFLLKVEYNPSLFTHPPTIYTLRLFPSLAIVSNEAMDMWKYLSHRRDLEALVANLWVISRVTAIFSPLRFCHFTFPPPPPPAFRFHSLTKVCRFWAAFAFLSC